MKKEIIKEYIEFAVKNGFWGYLKDFEITTYNKGYPNDCVSGLFVKFKTVREVEWGNPWSNMSWTDNIEVNDYVPVTDMIQSKGFLEAITRGIQKRDDFEEFAWGSLYEDISHDQADAIIGGELEGFINNLLLWTTR